MSLQKTPGKNIRLKLQLHGSSVWCISCSKMRLKVWLNNKICLHLVSAATDDVSIKEFINILLHVSFSHDMCQSLEFISNENILTHLCTEGVKQFPFSFLVFKYIQKQCKAVRSVMQTEVSHCKNTFVTCFRTSSLVLSTSLGSLTRPLLATVSSSYV